MGKEKGGQWLFWAQLCWLFPNIFLGDAEEVFLLFSARKRAWTARTWNRWQLFHRKLICHPLHLRLPLRHKGSGFAKSEMSLEIFALSSSQGLCQSQAPQAQKFRETSSSLESMVPFSLDYRSHKMCKEVVSCTVDPSQERDSFPSPLLSGHWGQYVRGGFAQWPWELTLMEVSAGSLTCLGDNIFSPRLLQFPSTVQKQWPRSQAPGNM